VISDCDFICDLPITGRLNAKRGLILINPEIMMDSDGDADNDNKRQRKKRLKKLLYEHTAVEDSSNDGQIDAEIRQQIENVQLPTSLPDKAVCLQIHTGND